MNKWSLLLILPCISLSSCSMVNDTLATLEYNKQAVDESTWAIQENIQAIEEANRSIAQNRAQLEAINKSLKDIGS